MPGSVPAPPQSSRFLLAGALALLGILALAISAATSYTSALRWIDHANEVQRNLDGWELTVADVQNDVRGYIATNQQMFVERHGPTLDHMHANTAALQRLVADNPIQTANVAAAGGKATAVLAHLERQMTRVREGHRDEALAVLEQGVGVRLMAEFRRAIARIRAEEQRLLVERRSRAAFRGKATLLSGTVFAPASPGLLSFAWSRQTRHE
ncbi:MAG: CHASE3 domain-containing protein, partial [Myxococcales bacterium]